MITALIRTHPGREEIVKRAIDSAKSQGCEVIIHYGEKTPGYEYNGYCNILKAQVKDGFFFFLDSDDFVIPGAIARILPRLNEDKANVVQMLRKGHAVPRGAEIRKGRIGMPCLILHSKFAGIADVTEDNYGDFFWVQKVTELIPWHFIRVPVVNAGNRSNGE